VLDARQRELLSAGHDSSLLRWQSGCLLAVISMLRAAARAGGGGGGGGVGLGAAVQQRARALVLSLTEVGAWGLWGARVVFETALFPNPTTLQPTHQPTTIPNSNP